MRANLCIVGAGPAGLWAAEAAAGEGASVVVFDAMPSAGRKFLVAGRGGLNLTNVAAGEAKWYRGSDLSWGEWEGMLAETGPEDLRSWAAELGVPTFAARNGRVYPVALKSAHLLRRWVARLKSRGVQFFHRHRWIGLCTDGAGRLREMEFHTTGGRKSVAAGAAVFALGGASWPRTGSDGAWQEIFEGLGIAVSPLVPANCGWEVDWPAEVAGKVAGMPLKNVAASAGCTTVRGELLVTSYGLEGGPIYALTPQLRSSPLLFLDLKPEFSLDQLLARMPASGRFHLHEALERCRIQATARAIVNSHPLRPDWRTPADFARAVKALPIPLRGPRPITEAISSAGGIRWDEVDLDLMSKKIPGVFVAGEMLDWEAPTGGFLMHGCFATGTRAGAAAAHFLRQ